MDYQENFQKFLKKMNDKKIDWDKKNSWETDIENSINNSVAKFINYFLS
jgi:hypothetical protein